MISSLVVAAIVFMPMLIETAISARNERGLRAQGAIEPDGDVYRAMAFAYPAAFVAMIAEGVLRGAGADGWFTGGLEGFAVAKALKYWAIASLGRRWTFRVLVPPGSTRIARGPYRWHAHPNYVAVVGELTGIAFATHALLTGPIAVAGFGWLMRRRISIEENTLARLESQR